MEAMKPGQQTGSRGLPKKVELALAKVREACRANAGKGHFPYAETYLNAMNQAMDEAEQYGKSREEGAKVQVLYILGNLGSWKGEEARAVKAELKAWARVE